ncbi:MAG: TonB-dependent receptor [Bacteroidota bacterium]
MARLLLTVCLLLIPSLAVASTGKISGRVTDATTGEPLIGVNVVIVGTTSGAATDANGYYAILNVRPGTYSVRASYLGYASRVVNEVRVQIDMTTELNFALVEESFEGEEVVVTAERPLVQRDLTNTATSISSQELAALPVENFNDVVNLQAGVVDGHFRGGRRGEVAYMVDGVSINDVFDHSFAYQVENNAIEEVQIITGTFNAEYGNAQSGVVNIVTRDGGSQYEGSLSAYTGDFLTTGTDVFSRLDDVRGTRAQEMQGTLSGPVPGMGSSLTFFASGRYVANDGHLYGRRVVRPLDQDAETAQTVTIDGRPVFVPAFGDSAYVPMNWGEQITGQMKLTARLGGHRLSFSGLVQDDQGQNYDHLFRYNPSGIPTVYGRSNSLLGTYSYLLGSRSYIDLRASYFENDVREYLYEDPLDPRYPRDDALQALGGNFAFFRGGARMRHFRRNTETLSGRLDFVSQITPRHQLKTGAEFRRHTLYLRDFEVKNNATTGFEPSIPPVDTPDHLRYTRQPYEMSAYIQDKMEFEYLVLNVGLRFDYFDASGEVLEDFGRPRTSPRRAAEPKWQLSPRVGLSYPISEAGAVRVAYGHFFQMPPFEFLYTNADYIYDPERGLGRAFGYADLEPQQTVAYELGLQQAFTDLIGMDVVVYYKNIRHLLGTRLEVIQPGFDEPFQLSYYGRFVNRDYGQVRGAILSFERRMAGGFALNVDYTFQIAQGNASDPRSVLIDEQAGVQPEKQLVPLDWDRRHQLNTSLTVGQPGNWLASLVGRLGTGLPYTPSVADERVGLENSARRPGFTTFDLFGTKEFTFAGIRGGLFTRVYNVFDTRNEVNIFSDTGRAFPNMRFHAGEPHGLNSKEEFFTRPDFYSAPRMVSIGARISF